MSDKKPFRHTRLLKIIKYFSVFLAVLATIVAIPYLVSIFEFKNTNYPNIYINNTNVSGKSSAETVNVLKQLYPQEKYDVLTFKLDGDDYKVDTKQAGFKFNYEKTAEAALKYGRSGSLLENYLAFLSSIDKKTNIPLMFEINRDELEKSISILLSDQQKDPIEPKATLENGQVKIDPGSPGEVIDSKELAGSVLVSISKYGDSVFQVNIKNVDKSLNEKETEEFKNEAQKFIGKTLTFYFENYEKKLKDNETIKLIAPRGGVKTEEVDTLIAEIKRNTEHPAVNSVFRFENDKVLEFKASKDGVEVDSPELKSAIIEGLSAVKSADTEMKIKIPVKTTPPEITTEKVNDLGIRELIGRGTSKFAHSIPSRVHNVGLASSKFNGVLVKPGDNFSFNTTLGDVSKFTGYKQAYVIREGKTILGDGGGVCQVSTTLFRALLNAGLPITERKGHSYRVGYYEQDSGPGLDATVYSPSPDLKFTNDTPGYILIQTIFDAKELTLVFELYGTKDGRIAKITKPVILSQTAPPDDLYIDDPTLPAGKIVQQEHKAWGAKVTFNYTVSKNGENVINKTFTTNYSPWRAVYLRGTGPAI